MARMEAKIAALLSLLAVILLLLRPPRLRGLVADCLLSMLDLRGFDGRRLVELVNRRRMFLLCNAILLIILKNAGLFAAPARPRRRSSATTAASAAAGGGAGSKPQPQSRTSIVTCRNSRAADESNAKSATVAADGGDLKPEPATETTRVQRRLPLTGAVHLVEKRSSDHSFNFDHAAGKEKITVVEDKSSCFRSEQIADDGRSRGEEEMAQQETEPECADDVDEMNKLFEEFIASMRRTMQLESMQLVEV